MRDPTSLPNMVRLGMACVDTGPNSSPALSRLAVLLLEKAYASGFNPRDSDGGDGYFWRRYAQAHTCCWQSGGGSVNKVRRSLGKLLLFNKCRRLK